MKRTAKTLAILPSTVSKAEHEDTVKESRPNAPTSAHPIQLTADLAVPDAALLVLRETLSQFTANLNALHRSGDPEVVHQARVGWRRFKSAYRLFKPGLVHRTKLQWQALSTLLKCLGDLRNLDVARVETLPPLEAEYVGKDAVRGKQWAKLNRLLTRAANRQRFAVRDILNSPAVRAAILTLAQSIERGDKPGSKTIENSHGDALRPWAKRRMRHLHKKLMESLKHGADSHAQHRSRILAKRLRYGLESLAPLLSARRAQAWHQEAVNLQQRIGANRDMVQAVKIVSNLKVDRDLIAFLSSHC
jgi:CHAD domain-containing protein